VTRKQEKEPWPVPDTLAEARTLYADLEAQRRDVDREVRDMARAERAKPARLRRRYWIGQAEGLYDAIVDAQERLIARYGDAVKRAANLPASEGRADG
jgi:hypothetical protein